MKKIVLAVSAVMLSAVTVAMAAGDPIATRKTLMDANGAAAGVSAAMLKGDLDYNPAIAKSAIMTLRAVAHSYGSFFPEGSDKGDTKAIAHFSDMHALKLLAKAAAPQFDRAFAALFA